MIETVFDSFDEEIMFEMDLRWWVGELLIQKGDKEITESTAYEKLRQTTPQLRRFVGDEALKKS